MKKKLLIVGGIIAVVLVAGGFFGMSGLSEGAKLPINGINLSEISDGSYIGSYNHGRWANTLVVHVKDNVIISIDIEKDVLAAFVTNCSGEVFRRVIEAQDTTVDAVSGATVTSKAYLKAIEDALQN
jgi:uncharacterized protein with FMN-binding domain